MPEKVPSRQRNTPPLASVTTAPLPSTCKKTEAGASAVAQAAQISSNPINWGIKTILNICLVNVRFTSHPICNNARLLLFITDKISGILPDPSKFCSLENFYLCTVQC